jgi:hypothetical protein
MSEYPKFKEHTLKMAEVSLLVKLGGLETERVDNVVDLDSSVLNTLLGLLGGSVGTSVYLIVSVGAPEFIHRTFRLYILTSTAPSVIIAQSTS